MSDLTVSCVITRSELSLPDLDLNTSPFRIGEGFEPGERSVNRITASSPWVHGEFLVQATYKQSVGTLPVWVEGSTPTDLRTNLTTAISAFSQFNYQITMTINGAEYAWDCDMADYNAGMSRDFMGALYVPVKFQFHRNPIPVGGPV